MELRRNLTLACAILATSVLTAPVTHAHAATVPGPPTGVAATADDGSATVSWTAPSDTGGSPITHYVVQPHVGPGHTATTSPKTITGLTNHQTFTFRVAAVNAEGQGPWSEPSNPVTIGVQTGLTIAPSASVVTYGTAVTMTGALRRSDTGTPLPGRTVTLNRCTIYQGNELCVTQWSGTTGADGGVRATFLPRMSRDYHFAYQHVADSYVDARSPDAFVAVRARVTSAISRTSMRLGSSAVVSGQVGPPHPGKRLYLQRLTGSGWQVVTYHLQEDDGSESFTVKPWARGTWTYRLWFRGDAEHLPGFSPSRSVTVS